MNTANFQDIQMIGHTLFTPKNKDFHWLDFLEYYRDKLKSIPKNDKENRISYTHLAIHLLNELEYQETVQPVLTYDMIYVLEYFIEQGINKITCERLKHHFEKPEDDIKYRTCEPINDGRITIAFPIRIDSEERAKNLDTVLAMLNKMEDVSIIILEADTTSKYKVNEDYKNVRHFFLEDNNAVFYRTRYINWLIKASLTPIVGIWDTDAIVAEDQIREAAAKIQSGEAIMSFPFNGFFYGLNPEQSNRARESLSFDSIHKEIESYKLMHGRGSVGGAYMVSKADYLLAGGENEHFYGWGPEDAERVKRMQILGYKVCTGTKPLFHLFHPRKANSRFFDKEIEIKNRQAYIDICGMDEWQLKEYIRYWDWAYGNDRAFNSHLTNKWTNKIIEL